MTRAGKADEVAATKQKLRSRVSESYNRRHFLLGPVSIFAGNDVCFCCNRRVFFLDATIGDFFCWHQQQFLLESMAIFAGIEQLLFVLMRNEDSFLLQPMAFFAGTGNNFCWNQIECFLLGYTNSMPFAATGNIF